ncbi:MAG: gp53-like domain-containing protein [Paraclostridium sp.]
MAGFDKIQITRDTKANIVANLSKLNEFEMVLATDEQKLYIKNQGVLVDLTGLGNSDINYDINSNVGVASSQLTKDLDVRVKTNTSGLDTKLDKGAYNGTAQDLNEEINQNKSDILLKMDKNNITFPHLELSGGSTSHIDFARNSGKDYESRLIQTDKGLALDNTGVSGTSGLLWEDGACPISKQQNGWCKLANGLIVQWGSAVLQVGQTEILFPISFSQHIQPNISLTNGDTNPTGADLIIGIRDSNYGGMNVIDNKSNVVKRVNWFAIGY